MDIKNFKENWIRDFQDFFVNSRTGDIMVKFTEDYINEHPNIDKSKILK